MKLEASTQQDIEQLSRWIENDPYHKDYLDPVWWLTGVDGSLLSFCLQDEHGPLCYVRLDEKVDNKIRLHTQFGPREQISKIRLVKGMFWCVPVVVDFCKQQNAEVVFQSVSPFLIGFMERKFGFQPVGGNDYMLRQEG